MTKIFDLIPSWLYCAVLALMAFFMLGQRVQVSNAKAAVARSAKDLSDYKLSVSETTRILQAANDRKAAAQITQQLEAQNAAKTREAALRTDADGLRTERDSLLNAIHIASRRDPVPSTTASAKAQPADPIADVLGECTAEVQELAGAADGHASDVETLEDSWPK